jgi:hypothetical protein
MIIIRDLLVGTTRFNDLARGLPGLSRTLLSKRLRQLEQAELVERIDGQYFLTEMGRDLEPVVFGLGRGARSGRSATRDPPSSTRNCWCGGCTRASTPRTCPIDVSCCTSPSRTTAASSGSSSNPQGRPCA